MVLLNSKSVDSILKRKAVKKEIILTYLTEKNVTVNIFTKNGLIQHMKQFWNASEHSFRFGSFELAADEGVR
jgi:Domain of unknown function (DUF4518)